MEKCGKDGIRLFFLCKKNGINITETRLFDSKKFMIEQLKNNRKWNRNQCERNVDWIYNSVNYKVKNKIITPL